MYKHTYKYACLIPWAMPPRATLFGDHSRALVIYYPPKLKTPPGWPVNKFWAPYRLAPTLDLRSRFFFCHYFACPMINPLDLKRHLPIQTWTNPLVYVPTTRRPHWLPPKKKKNLEDITLENNVCNSILFYHCKCSIEAGLHSAQHHDIPCNISWKLARQDHHPQQLLHAF